MGLKAELFALQSKNQEPKKKKKKAQRKKHFITEERCTEEKKLSEEKEVTVCLSMSVAIKEACEMFYNM